MPEQISHRGTNHTFARLTPEIVREIRVRGRAGERPTSIARGLGVGRTTVRAVLEGRTWKDVA
jgi:DNA invertase Pin-like site-specific DNA recombinase